jgi:hypothetical protein
VSVPWTGAITPSPKPEEMRDGSGKVPWPQPHYNSDALSEPGTDIGPPERLTLTSWELTAVSLIDALDGGRYRTPEDYARTAGITVV